MTLEVCVKCVYFLFDKKNSYTSVSLWCCDMSISFHWGSKMYIYIRELKNLNLYNQGISRINNLNYTLVTH